LCNHLRQRLSLDELHRVKVHAAFAAGGENGDDIGVVQASGGLSFIFEALELLGIESGGEGGHFEGHAAAERELLGLVNHPHTASANLTQQPEVTQSACE